MRLRFVGCSARHESAHTSQQFPTCPCRMSSGRGSSRNTTHGTDENWNVTSSRKSRGRFHPLGRSATSSIECAVRHFAHEM
eukprot:4167191-Pleurochrysis_carterae.AAC.1